MDEILASAIFISRTDTTAYSVLRRSPPPSNPKNHKKMKNLLFSPKWAQIYLKLIKILNLAPKVGSMGQKMMIKFRKCMSADAIFGILVVSCHVSDVDCRGAFRHGILRDSPPGGGIPGSVTS